MTENIKFTISKGDKVWVPDTEECFKSCTVKEIDEDKRQVVVFDDQYATQTLPKSSVFPMNPPNFNGVADNTELMHLHDPNLLHNVRYRYERGEIYTYTSFILIAVNPYKSLPLYGNDIIKKYFGQALGKQPPHVYAIADRAYKSMRGSKKSQSIVVSGESGAGKTESCKHVMRFLAAVSGSGAVGTIDELENKVLEANPILEAFGNAKTLRNNNSSRFGKFTELHFDNNAKMAGASIETYLLEKSRLVGQGKGERNFHIFYQLLKGATEDQKKKLHLTGPESYSFLSGSGCFEVEHVDDATEFKQVLKSMGVIGMSAAEQEGILAVLAGLLQLGNVKFIPNEAVPDASLLDPATVQAQEKAAQLLGLDVKILQEKMLNRVMVAGGTNETYTIPLTPAEAGFARDSLSKHIYQSLFDWIVSKINIAIPRSDSNRFIGILDISGFEIFEENSFEQFCINFANEKIQQYFNFQILKQEQEIYELEGLRWRKVEFVDNQSIIDLFEAKRTGILALLDEECVMPKSTDKTFAIKVHTTHTSNEFLTKPSYAKKKKRLNENEAFVVKHFAGEVIYETKNFLTKNNGTLHADLEQVLKTSTMKFFSAMFTPQQEDEEEVKYGQAGGRFKSIGGKFQGQLTNLMQVLGKTTSHFIRCMKPNTKQKPDLFIAPEVMTQLRYSGMCTALILLQAGFPTRISFEDLYERYSSKMPAVLAKLKPITFCEALLVALDLHGGKDFQMGLTKVFFRSGKLQFLDDLMSDNREAIEAVVGKVKKWLARKRFHAAIWSVVSINRFGKLIAKVRLVRRFRRAVRFHVRMIRVWLRTLGDIRRRLYDEATLAKKREEEAKRKEAERLAEQARREEEERRLREEEEARLRAEEEARRIAEENRRREEEARRAMENKIKELQENNSKLEDNFSTVNQAKDQALNQITQLNAKIEQLNAEIVNVTAKGKELDQRLKVEEEERAKTNKVLEGVQANLAAETEAKHEVERDLKAQKEALVAFQAKLEEERAAHKKELDSFRSATESDKDKVVSQLQDTMSAKAEVERQLRDETELRKSVEAKNSSLEESLKSEKQAFTAHKEDAAKKAEAAANEYQKLKEEMEAKIAQLQDQLKNETNNKIELQNKISDMDVSHKTASEQFARQKASLESQLSDERNTTSGLRDELAKLQAELTAALASIEHLTNQKRTLEDLLAKERQTTATLTAELEAEKQGRKEDNQKAAQTLEETEKKARNDLALKQAVIDSMSIDKKKLEERLAFISETTAKRISELETKLAHTEDKVHNLDQEVNRLGKNLDEKTSRLEHLEREKVNLIEIAVKCQEAQLKLRHVYEAFPKEQDLAKLIFGDINFNHILRGNYVYGVFQKQGGANQKKWAERHFILNDTFLFYYANKGDKEPKGIIRMDQAKAVEKTDLSALGKQHGFKISLRTGRDYFLSAPNAEECDKWVSLLTKVLP